jgi:hypothetical protein
LTAYAKAAWLAIILWAKFLWPGVRDALERAAVLVLGAVGVCGTARQTGLLRTRTAGACDALLSFGTRRVQARQQALAIDANARITALEVELATKGRRVGWRFEGIEAKTVVGTGRPNRTVVGVVALTDAAEGGAELTDGAVRVRRAQAPLRRRLGVAFVSAAQKAAPVAERSVGDAHVPRIVVAAGDAQERDEEYPEACHGSFDASPRGLFNGWTGLKTEQFHWITAPV